MANPFLGEIRIFPFGYQPMGWAACNGQTLPIRQNTALFSLLGTTYGGNGTSTFGLPNLQGLAPIQAGQGTGLSAYTLGQTGGETSVTLSQSQMPAHTHTPNGSTGSGTQESPLGGIWSAPGVGRGQKIYDPGAGSGPKMASTALSPIGGSQPHDNMMPYVTLNFCIAIQGVFPQRP